MSLKTSLRRNSNSAAAICLSFAALFYLLSIITPRQNAEDFGLCGDGIEYLLSEYKGKVFSQHTKNVFDLLDLYDCAFSAVGRIV